MQAIKRRAVTAALLGAVAVGSWVYSPNMARAGFSESGLAGPLFGGSGATAFSTLVFGTADIVYGAQGEWLPPIWAGFQLGLGALPNFVMGPCWIDVLGGGFGVGLGVVHLIFGTWFLTHGILSLILYEPPDDEAEDKTKPAASIDFGIAPIEGGAMGALVGRF